MRKEQKLSLTFKLIALLISFIGVEATYASTTTGTVKSSATISATCAVSTTNISFGTYNPNGSDAFATGTLTVSCTKGTTATVGLNSTNNSTSGDTTATTNTTPYAATESGGWFNRYLTDGTNKLLYNIFQDSTHSQIWGGPNYFAYTANSQKVFVSTGSPQVLTMYAAMGKAQYVAPNTYTDTVAVVITY